MVLKKKGGGKSGTSGFKPSGFCKGLVWEGGQEPRGQLQICLKFYQVKGNVKAILVRAQSLKLHIINKNIIMRGT